jgi:hypothetical protein
LRSSGWFNGGGEFCDRGAASAPSVLPSTVIHRFVESHATLIAIPCLIHVTVNMRSDDGHAVKRSGGWVRLGECARSSISEL